MEGDRIHHPFKRIEQLLERDAPNSAVSLNSWHGRLGQLDLHPGVPRDVRQLFDTARNIALYSHFAYRFHRPAELIAYTALEMALRERFVREAGPEVKAPKGMAKLLGIACDRGWLREDGFRLRRVRAINSLQSGYSMRMFRHMQENNLREYSYPEFVPSEDEIARVESSISVVDLLRTYIPRFRNDLAHGSSTLVPDSLGKLTDVADAIIQIFDGQSSLWIFSF